MIRYRSPMMIALLALLLIGSRATPAASGDPRGKRPVLTFAFFGCNRIDGPDWEASRSQNPSSANLPQLRQNFQDIAALSPDLLFLGGDLVMGYADDNGEVLRSQLGAWISLVKTLPRSRKTQLVAIAGNHELNRKIGERRLPNEAMDPIWSSLIQRAGLIPPGSIGPTPATSSDDKLTTDQRALSFSFDRGPARFIVLNTDTRVSAKDPKTGETKIAMTPVHWLDRELDRAEREPSIKCVIVLGHRNVADPANVKGDAPIDPECAEMMEKAIQSHKKVRAYICAHVHAFDIGPIGESGVQQLIFGNGGSSLEKAWNPARGCTFGFGYFKVFGDGSVSVTPYLRPAPKDYMSVATSPATAQQELLILPR